MTFKIDEVGFYKMRNGEKCEVVHINSDRCASNRGQRYETHWINGLCSTQYGTDYDIISKWVEPRKVTIPEIFVIRNKLYNEIKVTTDLHGYDRFELIERIPAHQITLTD